MSQREPISTRSRTDEQYNLFVAEITHIDYERISCSIKGLNDQMEHHNISIVPSAFSSGEGTEMTMPEPGGHVLAVNLESKGSFSKVVIVAFLATSVVKAKDAISHRPVEKVKVFSDRVRGTFRKAYPGQKTTTFTQGFTEKLDNGWDRAAADYSRDHLDPFRRTRIESTGRNVSYNDFGLKYEGFVHRPEASEEDIKWYYLPDGSKEWILYLDWKEKDWKTRYYSGQKDMMPFTERTEKIIEFALDYPLPHEIYETDMLDKLLGLTKPLPEWWKRTEILTKGGSTEPVEYDDETELISQDWDHPYDLKEKAVGPTKKEGKTPRRRGWIIEKSEGTLVGSNMFDQTTYAKVLKPSIFVVKKEGRFGSDTFSGYTPITKFPDQVEARMAASAWSLRFPYEYNTTRFEISKEGQVFFELGSTIPKENILWDPDKYEHPHGAGRSLDAHLVGSMHMVVGKNRDEEDSIELATLGSSILRLGADDTSLPNDRRKLLTQIRGKKDQVTDREIQFWDRPHRKLKSEGDCGDLENKTAGENVSLRAALDGGLFLRLGARNEASKRRHLINGYKDGQGKDRWTPESSDRIDSRSKGRPTYGAGDTKYRFHDLSITGKPTIGAKPYDKWSGDPVGDMDTTGLSGDIHAVRDILLRVGANPQNGQSILMDLAGGIVAAVGKDLQGRSLAGAFDGGIEWTVGQLNEKGKSARLEFNGDVDVFIRGNLHLNVTGDIIVESLRTCNVAKLMHVTKSTVIAQGAKVAHITEGLEIVHNQGLYTSAPILK